MACGWVKAIFHFCVNYSFNYNFLTCCKVNLSSQNVHSATVIVLSDNNSLLSYSSWHDIQSMCQTAWVIQSSQPSEVTDLEIYAHTYILEIHLSSRAVSESSCRLNNMKPDTPNSPASLCLEMDIPQRET